MVESFTLEKLMMIVDVVNILTQILQIVETKKIQYSYTNVIDEDSTFTY